MAGIIKRRLPVFSTFIKTLLDDADASTARTTLEITSGTYTPTLTNVANLDASTAFATGYYRIGDRVTVFGRFDADATAAASTSTQLGLSLPVASNFATSIQLSGTAVADGSTLDAAVRADATNDRADFVWLSNATANRTFRFHFTYQVI